MRAMPSPTEIDGADFLRPRGSADNFDLLAQDLGYFVRFDVGHPDSCFLVTVLRSQPRLQGLKPALPAQPFIQGSVDCALFRFQLFTQRVQLLAH